MKAKRLSECRYRNVVSHVSNSKFYYGEKAMCVALDFLQFLIYHNRVNCVLSKHREM